MHCILFTKKKLDSYFTERYIPLKDDYPRALQEADLSMRAGNIDSRNYLLIHSTADTIVHEQHSLIWSRALIDEGVGFRHQVLISHVTHVHNIKVN